ncbi:hypothetical protein DFH06DRAFT_1482739 [Mycena polygramma]|nr:hypothetical protein DFH06DRAFT_1482739 [Mycena polygramma]
MTIFSAPHYLDVYNNKAYENNPMNIRPFNFSPQPYWLPNFMDVFTWSLPFVGEKSAPLSHGNARRGAQHLHEGGARRGGAGGGGRGTSPTSPTSAEETDARRKVIKNKIMAVGGMLRVFALLREKVSELKSVSGSSKLPNGTLASGSEGIKSALTGDAYSSPTRACFLTHLQAQIRHRERAPAARPRRRLFGGGQGAHVVRSSSNSGASSPMPFTPTDEPDLSLGAASPSASPALGDKALAFDTAATPSAGSPSPSPSLTGSPYRRGHGRQASLGTTMTSPSTRRRGLEDTINLIQRVWDGKAPPVPRSGPAEGSRRRLRLRLLREE